MRTTSFSDSGAERRRKPPWTWMKTRWTQWRRPGPRWRPPDLDRDIPGPRQRPHGPDGDPWIQMETPQTQMKTLWTWMEIPLDPDGYHSRPRWRPPWTQTETPQTQMKIPWTQTETPRPWWKEHGMRDRDPLGGTWDQAPRQEVTSYRDPPVNRITDRQM